ncbi:MAG TPA: TonB family protein [Bryobacteraceae bacterium]|nr:TonB family protein [Bryobacteraceae bacterium]
MSLAVNMRIPIVLLSLTLGTLMAQQPTDGRGWLNQGVQAFKSARYGDAVASFQKAVDLNPNEVTPRLYLATAYMQQYIPGATSPENSDLAFKAESEFQQVLTLEANNKVALASLASLELNQKKWDEARSWYGRLLSVDPANRDAFYSLGFIDWSVWYPPYAQARMQLGMRQQDPGPMPEGAVKEDLRSRFRAVVEDGIANLQKALEIDPKYDDAMAYMNLFLREYADLRSTQADYLRDVAEADQWVQKALATKKEKAQQAALPGLVAPLPPPPPPPPPPGQGSNVQRIRIDGQVQQAMLVKQVPPVYPPLAQQAGISGTVRLGIVVTKDGTIANITVQSGHPLLIPPAIEAVKQWVYRPTLLNGQPVEVQTTVDVTFSSPGQ